MLVQFFEGLIVKNKLWGVNLRIHYIHYLSPQIQDLFSQKKTFKCHKPVKAFLRSWSVGFRRFEILRISCFEISSSEVASCPVWLSSGFENVVLGLQKWRWHQCVHRTWWWVMCMNTKVSFAIKFKSIRQRSSSCWLEESVHRECWQTERNVRLAHVVGTDSAVWPPSHA